MSAVGVLRRASSVAAAAPRDAGGGARAPRRCRCGAACAACCGCCLCWRCGDFDCSFRAMQWIAACAAASNTGLINSYVTTLEQKFGFSAASVATIVVMYDTSYAALSVPMAHLGRSRIPRFVGVGASGYCVACVVYGLSEHYLSFLLANLTMGFCASSLWVLSPSHIDDNVADKLLVPTFVAHFTLAVVVGAVSGYAIAGAAFMFDTDGACEPEIECTGDCPPAGRIAPDCNVWRYPFVFVAVVQLPFCVWFAQSKPKYVQYLDLHLLFGRVLEDGLRQIYWAKWRRWVSLRARRRRKMLAESQMMNASMASGARTPWASHHDSITASTASSSLRLVKRPRRFSDADPVACPVSPRFGGGRQVLTVMPVPKAGEGGGEDAVPPGSLRPRQVGAAEALAGIVVDRSFADIMCDVLGNARLWSLLLSEAVSAFSGASVLLFLPRFYELGLGQAKQAAVNLTILPVPFAMAGTVAGGMLVKRFHLGIRRQFMVAIVSNVLGSLAALAFFAESIALMVACFCGVCFFTFTAGPMIVNLMQRVVPQTHTAHAMSLANVSGRCLGSIPGPIVMGWLLDTWGGTVIGMRWIYASVLGGCNIGAAAIALVGWWLTDPTEGELLPPPPLKPPVELCPPESDVILISPGKQPEQCTIVEASS